MPPPGGRNGYLTEEEKKNKPKVTKDCAHIEVLLQQLYARPLQQAI